MAQQNKKRCFEYVLGNTSPVSVAEIVSATGIQDMDARYALSELVNQGELSKTKNRHNIAMFERSRRHDPVKKYLHRRWCGCLKFLEEEYE